MHRQPESSQCEQGEPPPRPLFLPPLAGSGPSQATSSIAGENLVLRNRVVLRRVPEQGAQPTESAVQLPPLPLQGLARARPVELGSNREAPRNATEVRAFHGRHGLARTPELATAETPPSVGLGRGVALPPAVISLPATPIPGTVLPVTVQRYPPPGRLARNMEDGYGMGPLEASVFRTPRPTEFDGSNPRDWVEKMDDIFDCYRTSEDERLRIAPRFFDGDARRWYRMIRDRGESMESWDELKNRIIRRFCYVTSYGVVESLRKLRYKGDIGEYMHEFQGCISKGELPSESQLLDAFVAGLPGHLVAETQGAECRTWDEMAEQILESAGARIKKMQHWYANAHPDLREQARRNDYLRLFDPNGKGNYPAEKQDRVRDTGGHNDRPHHNQQQVGKAGSSHVRGRDGKPFVKPAWKATSQVQCFGCKGFGHYRNECPNQQTPVNANDNSETSPSRKVGN